jgi:hypothetical protein
MVNASLPCQPDLEQRHVNRPSLSQALLTELPNKPNNRRNAGEFVIVARPTNPKPQAAGCRAAGLAFPPAAGTDSHGPMDPPNIRLRGDG